MHLYGTLLYFSSCLVLSFAFFEANNELNGIGRVNRTCKNVTFDHTEWTRYNSSTVQVLDHSFSEYHLRKNGSILDVCYPFDHYFQDCYTYCIADKYFNQRDDGRLYFQLEQQVFEFGEYYVNGSLFCICSNNVTVEDGKGLPQIWPFVVTIPCVLLGIAFVCTVTYKGDRNSNKCQLSHLFSIFFAYFMLALCHFAFQHLTNFTCVAIAILTLWGYLAAFSWLNALGVDIFLKFARFPHYEESERYFFWYSFYGWSLPTVVTLIALLVDQYAPNSKYSPDFKACCWFNGNNPAYLVFYYVPLTFVLVVNLFLFVGTVFHLNRIGKSIQMVNKKIHRKLFLVYIELFVVMGMAWTVDLVCWNVATAYHLEIVHVINEAAKFLMAIFVSLIYMCMRDVWKFFSCHGAILGCMENPPKGGCDKQ